MNPGYIVILALIFAGLLAARIAFLLILRRNETPRHTDTPDRWPNATVIPTDTPSNETHP